MGHRSGEFATIVGLVVGSRPAISPVGSSLRKRTPKSSRRELTLTPATSRDQLPRPGRSPARPAKHSVWVRWCPPVPVEMSPARREQGAESRSLRERGACICFTDQPLPSQYSSPLRHSPRPDGLLTHAHLAGAMGSFPNDGQDTAPCGLVEGGPDGEAYDEAGSEARPGGRLLRRLPFVPLECPAKRLAHDQIVAIQ